MMKQFVVVVLLIALFSLPGCEKQDTQRCGGMDPANELPWLKNEITRLSSLSICSSISRSTYKEQTVFIFSNCTPNVNSIPFLYGCDGNKLDLSPGDYQELKFTGNIELIWKNN
jgi:hypothetical protein